MTEFTNNRDFKNAKGYRVDIFRTDRTSMAAFPTLEEAKAWAEENSPYKGGVWYGMSYLSNDADWVGFGNNVHNTHAMINYHNVLDHLAQWITPKTGEWEAHYPTVAEAIEQVFYKALKSGELLSWYEREFKT